MRNTCLIKSNDDIFVIPVPFRTSFSISTKQFLSNSSCFKLNSTIPSIVRVSCIIFSNYNA